MSDLKEGEIMEKLSIVDEYLTKSYLNENIYKSLNILQYIMSRLDNSMINFKKLHMVLEKLIEIFQKTDSDHGNFVFGGCADKVVRFVLTIVLFFYNGIIFWIVHGKSFPRKRFHGWPHLTPYGAGEQKNGRKEKNAFHNRYRFYQEEFCYSKTYYITISNPRNP